ncbi:MAG: YtxH domain-containing protein, partial [Pyrinomonadaceae bacterium]
MNQLTQHSIDSGADLSSRLPSMKMSKTSSGIGSNLSYLLIGGGIGATLALLFAPKSGTELRTDVVNAAQKGYDSSLDMAQKLMDQSRDLYGTLKDKADQMTGGAASRLEGQVMDTVSNVASSTGMNTGLTNDLPNGG